MRMFVTAALLLALAGCGGGEAPPTDPSDLPPLTEEQKAEIQTLDAEIADEEKTGGGMISQ